LTITVRSDALTSPLLSTFENVLALPQVRFFQDGRRPEGLIWDPGRQVLLDEALPNLHTLPPRLALQLDEEALIPLAAQSWNEAAMLEEPAIYGGFLIRHFGHFIHESLSRLWWLAPGEGMESSAQDASQQLQQLNADVVFFMPEWLDNGKDLLPYMEEILGLLGLPARRIRILQRPLRFRQLWIPACVWGFATHPQTLDQRLGCDTRGLMRHLLASAQVEAPALDPPSKVYVTRSGLPLSLGRLIGDVVLDPLLAEAGYRVFHPENVSLAEQIRVYSQAKDLIFMDGSSLYVLWFAKLQPGSRVRVILRRRQGRWMCQQLLALLPAAATLDWEVVDALRAEALTSGQDWESHNVADLSSLLQHLLGAVPSVLPEAAQEVLGPYSQQLVQDSSPEQLARVMEALMTALATDGPKRLSRPKRLYQKVRRLFRASTEN
jgi:hypothetical protein